jgi:hypothetical protein
VVDVDVILRSLLTGLTAAKTNLGVYDAYYEGLQPIRFLAPAMQAEFGDRITALTINWPAMVADAVEGRLDVEGFRYAGNSSGDESLWAVWQGNDLDEQSQQAHLDAVALSRSYAIVGPGDSPDDMPIVTVESGMQMFARRDPRTRRVISAVKRWDVLDDYGNPLAQYASLYLPGRRATYIFNGAEAGWQVTGPVDEYDESIMAVVPLVNRPRILRPDGRSEFYDVIPLADAANKMATDMMVSGEYHAMPRRYAGGVTEKDFVDENGNALSAWSRDAGTLWATENAEAKFGQFTESDLAVFHNTIKLLAQIVIQLTGLPPHYGIGTGEATPPSADAIRSSESQLVKRVERKQTYFGGAWEDVMRLILKMQGNFDDKARSLETIWRDPSTPTIAQKADAALKLATPLTPGGRAIVPIEMTREDLGYTPEQRRRMAEMDREAEQDPYLREVAQKTALNPPGGSRAGAGAPAGG